MRQAPPGWVHTENPFRFQMLKSREKYCYTRQRNREIHFARNSYLPPKIPRTPKNTKIQLIWQNSHPLLKVTKHQNSNQLAKKPAALGFRRIELVKIAIFSKLTSLPESTTWSSESYPSQAVTDGRDSSLQDIKINDTGLGGENHRLITQGWPPVVNQNRCRPQALKWHTPSSYYTPYRPSSAIHNRNGKISSMITKM